MREGQNPNEPTFSERVIQAALSILSGRVTTYGRISRACGGGAMAAQSITSILSKAELKDGVSIPFHRIVYADGRIWTSPRHHKARIKRYIQEGIQVDKKGKIENFYEVLYEFE